MRRRGYRARAHAFCAPASGAGEPNRGTTMLKWALPRRLAHCRSARVHRRCRRRSVSEILFGVFLVVFVILLVLALGRGALLKPTDSGAVPIRWCAGVCFDVWDEQVRIVVLRRVN